MRLLMSNMRLPEERLGDLNASLGACRVAEERIGRLVAKYGRETVLGCITMNLDRSERRLRDRIRELPDGEYVYEDYLEFYDAGRLDPVLMRLKLTVDGDHVVADFDGSNPQVPGVVNSSLAVAGAGVFVALKATLDPHGPVNSGAFRAFTLRAPEASIVDVRPEAPAGAHGEVRKRVVSVMLGALAQVIPERVSGDLSGTSFPNSIGGYSATRDRRYVYVEVPAGGNGGFEGHDGSSAFVNVDFGAIRSIHNVESLESEMPIFVERCELRSDSGGEGRFRGGLGMYRALRLEEGEAVYSVLGDRAFIPPFGVDGAGPARPVRVAKVREDRTVEFDTPGKVTGHPIAEGDCVVMESAGGGGYGDPLRRDPEAVRADVVAGYVTEERARQGYGGRIRRLGQCRCSRDDCPARTDCRFATTPVGRRRRAACVHGRQGDAPRRAPERSDGRTAGHRPRHPCRAARQAPGAIASVGENRRRDRRRRLPDECLRASGAGRRGGRHRDSADAADPAGHGGSRGIGPGRNPRPRRGGRCTSRPPAEDYRSRQGPRSILPSETCAAESASASITFF